MGQYNQAVITTAGQGLLAGVIASGKALAFTNAKTSTHIYPSGLEALTDITDVMQTDAVSSATVMSNTQVKISTRFTNEGITAAYDINTIGIFAKAEGDTNDTLFAVITAVTPDAMPKYTTTNPVAYIYDITVGMSNADSITLNVSPTGTPSYGDLAAAQTAAENASAANLAPAYDSTATYAKDDFCVNGGKLYQCNADISTAEAFNPAHWTEVKVTEVMGGGGGVTPEIMAQIENAQWKTEGTEQLFSETVTTVDDGQMSYADLSYSEPITADTLIVTFNGTEYVCPAQKDGLTVVYGATVDPDTGGLNWDVCPFFIESVSGHGNSISTETAGTYTVTASANEVTYTEAFKNGINANLFKEVDNLSEADVAIVNFSSRVRIPLSVCSITGNGNSASIDISANVIERNFEGEYVFWKASNDAFVGNNAYIYKDSDALMLAVTDVTRVKPAENLYTFSICGTNFYPLTSGYAVKYYKLLPSSTNA